MPRRQGQRDQPETVAQPVFGSGSPQVDRGSWRGSRHHPGLSPRSDQIKRNAPATHDSNTSLTELPATYPTARPGRAASARSTRPGALATPSLPLNRVGLSSGMASSCASSAATRTGQFGVVRGLFRVADEFKVFRPGHPRIADGLDRCGGHRREQLFPEIGSSSSASSCSAAFASFASPCAGPPETGSTGTDGGIGVGEPEHHADERDTVRDAVMNACDNTAEPRHVFDQRDLPQRLRGVERLASSCPRKNFSSSSFRRCPAARHDADACRCRKSDRHPPVEPAARLSLRRAGENAETARARCDGRLQPLRAVDGAFEYENADDHHQISGRIGPCAARRCRPNSIFALDHDPYGRGFG